MAASLVSHLVSYDVRTFIERLKSLTKEDGLIYLTLLGDDDQWAAHPWAKAMPFDEAQAIIGETGLRPLLRSVEWLEGHLYSAEPKFWHLYQFMLVSQSRADECV